MPYVPHTATEPRMQGSPQREEWPARISTRGPLLADLESIARRGLDRSSLLYRAHVKVGVARNSLQRAEIGDFLS